MLWRRPVFFRQNSSAIFPYCPPVNSVATIKPGKLNVRHQKSERDRRRHRRIERDRRSLRARIRGARGDRRNLGRKSSRRHGRQGHWRPVLALRCRRRDRVRGLRRGGRDCDGTGRLSRQQRWHPSEIGHETARFPARRLGCDRAGGSARRLPVVPLFRRADGGARARVDRQYLLGRRHDVDSAACLYPGQGCCHRHDANIGRRMGALECPGQRGLSRRHPHPGVEGGAGARRPRCIDGEDRFPDQPADRARRDRDRRRVSGFVRSLRHHRREPAGRLRLARLRWLAFLWRSARAVRSAQIEPRNLIGDFRLRVLAKQPLDPGEQAVLVQPDLSGRGIEAQHL